MTTEKKPRFVKMMICYFQHEKSRRVGHNEIIEKRKVFRKGYDTTGPNDERYYVSASSGIGGSRWSLSSIRII